jgi:ribosomal protein S18 acetylase RimI-like enzyme
MSDEPIHVRRAEVRDLPTLARFAMALAQLHSTFDEERFTVPADGEVTFKRFFKAELMREDTVLLLAEAGSTPMGYAFVRIEPASIEELRASGAWLHDIYVVPGARTRGVGRHLIEAASEAARNLGSKSLSLSVSPHNASGRALFERLGFRTTMIEMRAELDD